MGLFLAMSGVVGASQSDVETALRSYARLNGGLMEEGASTSEEDEWLVLSETMGGVTVLYPSYFFDWDHASSFMSQELGKPVFSFHIHDGDFWMYTLYDHGEAVDQFNPVPEYWTELDDEERKEWQGNAVRVADRVPGLLPQQIANYLVAWGEEVLQSEQRSKAYPDDQHCYGDDWQLLDFMRRLQLDYPVDDRGKYHGDTFRFECNSPENG